MTNISKTTILIYERSSSEQSALVNNSVSMSLWWWVSKAKSKMRKDVECWLSCVCQVLILKMFFSHFFFVCLSLSPNSFPVNILNFEHSKKIKKGYLFSTHSTYLMCLFYFFAPLFTLVLWNVPRNISFIILWCYELLFKSTSNLSVFFLTYYTYNTYLLLV